MISKEELEKLSISVNVPTKFILDKKYNIECIRLYILISGIAKASGSKEVGHCKINLDDFSKDYFIELPKIKEFLSILEQDSFLRIIKIL